MTVTIDGFVFGRSNVSRPRVLPRGVSRREPSACTAVQPRALHDRQPRSDRTGARRQARSDGELLCSLGNGVIGTLHEPTMQVT
jgi:hypothetical protein